MQQIVGGALRTNHWRCTVSKLCLLSSVKLLSMGRRHIESTKRLQREVKEPLDLGPIA